MSVTPPTEMVLDCVVGAATLTWLFGLGTTDLKRELVSEQANWEISELNSPTALRRFGAPFKSEFGEVSPLDSELPILRYIFVHHVREFPFLDKAKEKEFWQDKLQVVRLISNLLGVAGTDHGFPIPSFSSRSRARISRHPRTDWKKQRGANWP